MKITALAVVALAASASAAPLRLISLPESETPSLPAGPERAASDWAQYFLTTAVGSGSRLSSGTSETLASPYPHAHPSQTLAGPQAAFWDLRKLIPSFRARASAIASYHSHLVAVDPAALLDDGGVGDEEQDLPLTDDEVRPRVYAAHDRAEFQDRIRAIIAEANARVVERPDQYRPAQLDGHRRHPHRPHHHPHDQQQPQPFRVRLHRAIHHLRSTEALAVAFVVGCGLGSIMHFFVVLFIVGFRMWAGHPVRERAEADSERQALSGRGEIKLETAEQSEARVSFVDEKVQVKMATAGL